MPTTEKLPISNTTILYKETKWSRYHVVSVESSPLLFHSVRELSCEPNSQLNVLFYHQMKFYVNGPGHITKLSAMPIYGKYV